MGTDDHGASTPESEAAEEADWALATAETLQAKGDLQGARNWFRRAAEHLMDAGLDDRALAVAKQVAALSEPPPPAPMSTAPPPDSLPPFDMFLSGPPPEDTSPPTERVPAPTNVRMPEPHVPDDELPTPMAPMTLVPVAAPALHAPPSLHASAAVLQVGPPVPAPALTAPVVSVSVGYDPARAMASEGAAALLMALPLFADLFSDRVRALARESVIVPLHAGQELSLPTPGDHAVAAPLWVIIEGQVQLSVGGVPIGAQLGPGDFVGELSAYYESGCLFRAEARTAGRALCVAPTVLQALARQYDGVRVALEESAWERSFAALGHASSLLASVEPSQRASLYSRFEPVQLAPGEAMLTEGEITQWVWLIAAGSVERYGGALGARVQRAGAGAAVGAVSAWEAGPSGVGVRVRRLTLAARVRAEVFRAMGAEAVGLRSARARADVW